MARMPSLRTVAVRLLTATVVGVVISLTAYLAAWHQYRGFYFADIQWMEVHDLEVLHETLELHHKKTGVYPSRLEDLDPIASAQFRKRTDEDKLVDLWRNPFQYSSDGTQYTLYSLGRDGQPGGDGLDADIYGRGKQDFLPTLVQFTTDPMSRGFRFTCEMAGLSGFALCLVLGLGKTWSRQSLLKNLVGLAVTAGACVFAAVVMSFLHIPSGH